MEAAVTVARLTIEDLEAMPDDGRRYELVGGAIVMTPAPGLGHQRVSQRLLVRLAQAWPEMEVFHAPTDLDLPGDQRVEPDLIVVERGRTGARLGLPVALVVEIVSPGSVTHDRVTKRATYAAAGIPHFWLVEPDDGRITCLVLEGDQYRVDVEGAVVEVEQPVRLRLSITELTTP
jgi:Uma2 family endonuclease